MSESINIKTEDIDRLLACCDGQAALLYLHTLRSGSFSMSRAARELGWSEKETALAADKLRKLGLAPGEQHLPSADELPQYSSADITRRAQSDPAFEALVFEVQRALGKLLSSNDLRILFGVYDHLGLPAEVIMLLIHHCTERYQEQAGAGRLPTMRYIEKEAWHWANSEIITLEAAEEHIRRERERGDLRQRAKEAMQIKGRSLTETERKYIDSWLELGYCPEALGIAYDRTVIGTGKLTWRYMDRIIRAWHEKGLHTPQEIEQGDRRSIRRPSQDSTSQEGVREIENMRRMYEQMKNRG